MVHQRRRPSNDDDRIRDSQRHLNRLVAELLEESVAQGEAWIATNPERAERAVLVYDGFVTLSSDKTDALIVTAKDYAEGDAELTIRHSL